MLYSLLFAFANLFCGQPQSLAKATKTNNAAILVRVSDLRKNSGRLLIALYNGKTPFLSETNLPPGFVADIKNGKAEKLLDNLTPGEYAISVMHDENGNHKMDYNALGIPKEGYGLSNNVKIYFSKPDYKPCTFTIKAGETRTINISMKYFL